MPPLHRVIRFYHCRLSTAACLPRQICFPFCFLEKMSASRKPIPGRSAYSSFTAQKPFGNDSSAEETRQTSGEKSINEKQFQSIYEKVFPSLSVNAGLSSKGGNLKKGSKGTDSGLKLKQEAVNSSEVEGIANVPSLQGENGTGADSGLWLCPGTVTLSEHERIVDVAYMQEEHNFPSHFVKKVYSNYVEKSPYGNCKSNNVVGIKSSSRSEGLPKLERFNICLPRFRDIRTQEILRPGMVLLKHYISIREQINIVKTCNSLGEGPGGFYRPGYKDGAKLRLHMMCLGMNWDPQTRKYDKRHPVNNCEPPEIPLGFHLLVQRAIKDAHCLIKKDTEMVDPEYILPSMSPNICIVNFYSIHGRLGLHQDRDESRQSLHNGLPVVSFSIGDSAEFLYGDGREVDQAKKVLLESGDVLLFGGESRMVFHGVPSIVPSSAPEPLKTNSGLRHGRLNLTFRQF